MVSLYYILDEAGNPKKCDIEQFIEWSQDFAIDRRRIDYTEVGDVNISTVFLGLDHRFSSVGDPILFETMIFGGEHDSFQMRYTTKAAAIAGHKEALKMVVDSLPLIIPE